MTKYGSDEALGRRADPIKLLCAGDAARTLGLNAPRSAVAQAFFALALAAAQLTTSCSTDGAGPTDGACGNENIDRSATLQVLDSAGKTAVAAYDIDIAALASGANRDTLFTIANAANAITGRALVVKSVVLLETDGDDNPTPDKAFSCLTADGKDCVGAVWPAIIPAGLDKSCAPTGAVAAAKLTIRYTRGGAPDLRRLKLAVSFGGDAKLGDTPWTATFATRLGSPKISCSPLATDFGKIGLSEGATSTVTCANTGKGAGLITGATMLGSLPLHAKLGDFVITAASPLPLGKSVAIAAGQSIDITVSFDKLLSEQKAQAILRLNTSEAGKEQLDLSFVVNTTGPCATFSPNVPMDFGEQPVGKPQAKEILIKSCGTEDLQLTSVAIAASSDPGFSLSFGSTCFSGKQPSVAAPFVIAKGTVCSLTVIYTAPQLGANSKGKLVMQGNSGTSELALSGQAPSSIQCPSACMTVKLASGVAITGEVLPQSKLKFDASCSQPAASGQAIAKYKWALQQPLGSYATFAPSGSVKAPQLQPNIAGKYTISLDIADAADTQGCKPISYDLNVLSDDKLYVELTWDTPADPDKTDEQAVTPGAKLVGSDLDLHLAHAEATDEVGQADVDKNGEPDPWYAPCLDCSVWNVIGKWGTADNYDDDAALDRDDKDGWGPEIIAIHVPQVGVAYHIGVYYFSHNGFGKSTPTIKVYLDGKLAATKVGPVMDMLDMWCVGKTSWTPNQFVPCKGADAKGDLLTKKYPIQPNKSLKCP